MEKLTADLVTDAAQDFYMAQRSRRPNARYIIDRSDAAITVRVVTIGDTSEPDGGIDIVIKRVGEFISRMTTDAQCELTSDSYGMKIDQLETTPGNRRASKPR